MGVAEGSAISCQEDPHTAGNRATGNVLAFANKGRERDQIDGSALALAAVAREVEGRASASTHPGDAHRTLAQSVLEQRDNAGPAHPPTPATAAALPPKAGDNRSPVRAGGAHGSSRHVMTTRSSGRLPTMIRPQTPSLMVICSTETASTRR
jgi:hypothetical protein